MLKRLERETGQPIEKIELPSNRAIHKQRVARFHERITEGLTHSELETFEAIIDHYRRENDVPLEHIAAALAVLANGEQPLLANESLKPTTFGNDKHKGGKTSGGGFGCGAHVMMFGAPGVTVPVWLTGVGIIVLPFVNGLTILRPSSVQTSPPPAWQPKGNCALLNVPSCAITSA